MTKIRIGWSWSKKYNITKVHQTNHYTIAGMLMLLFQFIKLVFPALYKNFQKLENGQSIHF